MGDTVALRADGLTKRYGRARGIESVDLQVAHGEVFGFLGPNGAGKTTFIRTILDLLHPTAGTATVLGLDSQRDSMAIRRRVGYLPGELSLWPSETVRSVLQHLARLRGGVSQSSMDALADRFDVTLDRKIRDLSKGNRQKIGLVQAFMHDPELLILDEPTSGLDPLQQREFRTLALERAASGVTVFLSSHVLSEVEHTATRVAVLREGRIVTVDDVAALKARALRQFEVTFAYPIDTNELATIEGVRVLGGHGAVVDLAITGSVDPLIKALAGFDVVNLVSHEPDLEQIVFSYYGGSHAG
ncbi:MAG: beta-exotoxin transport system ATP-binding protein [Acidimicrobiaceae bacterium]|jgi:ABC-2 type transport system ATP-binding protein